MQDHMRVTEANKEGRRLFSLGDDTEGGAVLKGGEN